MIIERGRFIDSILRLFSKKHIENSEVFAEQILIPDVVKKFYCRRMQMHVHLCNMTSCRFFSSCVPT